MLQALIRTISDIEVFTGDEGVSPINVIKTINVIKINHKCNNF